MVYISSAAEIQYNLIEMRHAIGDNPSAVPDIDPEFLAILNNDIKNLENRVSKIVQKELHALRASIHDMGTAIAGNDPIKGIEVKSKLEIQSDQKLVTSMKELSSEYIRVPSEVEKEYGYYRITGDGHCFYRSMATVLFFEKKIGKVKAVFEELLKDTSHLEKSDYTLLDRALDGMIDGSLAPELVLNHQKISDLFVKSLRVLGALSLQKKIEELKNSTKSRAELAIDVARIKVDIQEIIDVDGFSADVLDDGPVVTAKDEEGVKAYCKKIVDFRKAQYGGYLEASLFRKLFDFNYDPAVAFDALDKMSQEEAQIRAHRLLHNGIHWNVAAPKPLHDGEQAVDTRQVQPKSISVAAS